MIVVDASAIIELLLRSPTGAAVETRLFHPDETIHVPALIDLEVAQVLRRYVARGDMNEPRARASLELLIAFPMERYSHDPLVRRIWALRDTMTAYDAAYVALAEGLRAALVTCDAKLAAAPGIRTAVELIQ